MPMPKREKVGKASWAPAAMLNVTEKPAEGRLRWCNIDPSNIQKKMAEGWVMADSINGVRAKHEHPEGIEDGSPMGGLKQYRDLQLMYLPQDLYEARTAYFENLTKQQTAGLKRTVETENEAAARATGASKAHITGNITIIDR